MRNLILGMGVPLASVVLMGCSSTGKLQMRLTDAPADLTAADTIVVTIDEVRVHLVDGKDTDVDTDVDTDTTDTDLTSANDWQTVCDAPGDFDLLTLTDGVSTPICPAVTLDAGRITQIRLVVSAGTVTWTDGRSPSTLEVPSSVLHLVTPNLEIAAGETLDVTLDFDAAKSIEEADSKLILKPTIKVVE